MPKSAKLDDDVKDALKYILKECKREDIEMRKSQVKEWKKFEEYWHGVQYLFWSERDQTWLSPADGSVNNNLGADEDDEDFGQFYDYVLNIYRAHGEAIIAALSARIPNLRFVPDDADETDDVMTARTYSKIADLVSRHNNAAMVFLKGIFFLWNGGIVASYRHKEADKKYGEYSIPEYEVVEQPVTKLACPECGYESPDPVGSFTEQENPDSGQDTNTCPQCGSPLIPTQSVEQVPQQTGTKILPKTRVKLDVFGPLQFKVSYYATKQSECDYLLLFLDSSKSTIKGVLQPDFKDSELTDSIEGGTIESLDRFSRSAYLYPDGNEPNQRDLSTITQAWFRPCTYWKIAAEKVRLKLAKLYPDGVHCTFVDKQDILVENDVTKPENEDLDKRWELGQAGLSTFIHSDPVGKPLIPVQDLENQLANITIDTIDHGIPSEYAASDMLNFDQYGKCEVKPGSIYKVTKKPNEAIAASFHTGARATLSKEVPAFKQQLDQAGQFLVGSFPSIYGGPSEGKSRTFAEYQQSRAMALQRLQIVWQYIVDWWKRTIEGCVRMYVETVVEDDKFVQFADGKYINVWIRQSELKGKVGGVESESSDQFPVSIMQKNALLMKLIELNNPMINSALYTPDNARVLQDSLALNEFKLPGETQRIKQVLELDELTQSEPIDMQTSSVPIDPAVDDDAVHSATVRSFCVDTVGLDLKKTNPAAYMNCILHMKAHELNLQLKTLTMQHNAPPGAEPPSAEGPPE